MADKKKDMMKSAEAKLLTESGYAGFGAMDVRKFSNYLRDMNGDTAKALRAFKDYIESKPTKPEEKPDPVAEQLSALLNKAFPNGEGISLGRYGYTIMKAKGRGVEPGIAVYKNEKPE